MYSIAATYITYKVVGPPDKPSAHPTPCMVVTVVLTVFPMLYNCQLVLLNQRGIFKEGRHVRDVFSTTWYVTPEREGPSLLSSEASCRGAGNGIVVNGD